MLVSSEERKCPRGEVGAATSVCHLAAVTWLLSPASTWRGEALSKTPEGREAGAKINGQTFCLETRSGKQEQNSLEFNNSVMWFAGGWQRLRGAPGAVP